jgi:gamma-glutamyl hercynylcysteine S-oxide synthase
MATFQAAPEQLSSLLSRIQEARTRTDALFKLLPPNSFYERPIPERHRMIFYLGHLETFDWNLLSGHLGLETHNAEFDKLFAFGIDPVGGGLPTDVPADWPGIAQIEKYNGNIRARIDERLRSMPSSRSSEQLAAHEALLHVAIEHRLMHAETLAYLLHNLPIEKKASAAATTSDARPADARASAAAPPKPYQVAIPAGTATLGQSHRGIHSFGWDNEFEEQRVHVPPFSIDAFPVTNGEYLKFVRAGGYEDSSYWTPENWAWRRVEKLEHPHFWIPRSGAPASDPDKQWNYRAMFSVIPLPLSCPVYVSHAEASAFARWAGKQLPTEAQWHRAAYGTPAGTERMYPWGDNPPEKSHGNFHHERWDSSPVDAHPAGTSAFGVADLLGNGWEWTSTVFAPLPGFQPFSFYPGYSADFFDGKHFVMKGGSARTDACMLRRSFRNWFQPRYSYVYATFRCVEE